MSLSPSLETSLFFALAGLLVSTAWLLAPDNWGPLWFLCLGLFFAAAVLVLANLQVARGIISDVSTSRRVGAAAILSATWLITLCAFAFPLMLLDRFDFHPGRSFTIAAVSMLSGVAAASSCTAAALGVMTRKFDKRALKQLLFVGTATVLLYALHSGLMDLGLFTSFDSPRFEIGLLITPGLTAYASVFGLGLARSLGTQPQKSE